MIHVSFFAVVSVFIVDLTICFIHRELKFIMIIVVAMLLLYFVYLYVGVYVF
jgi:hypothetical protein